VCRLLLCRVISAQIFSYIEKPVVGSKDISWNSQRLKSQSESVRAGKVESCICVCACVLLVYSIGKLICYLIRNYDFLSRSS
jgi:hypothetical protein